MNVITNYLSVLQARDDFIARMHQLVEDAELLASFAPLPEDLRPATPEDIQCGAVIWYPERRIEYPLNVLNPNESGDANDARCWEVVEDVLRPSDAWKAYNAKSGSRYGLDGAEDEPEHVVKLLKIGHVSKQAHTATHKLNNGLAVEIRAAKALDMPQGLIVALLQAHLQRETQLMLDA